MSFFGTASLNGFSQSETNRLDGLKNMFPSVFFIKHWMESCVINYNAECTTVWKIYTIVQRERWTKVTVVTGLLSFPNTPTLALDDLLSHACCTQIVEEKRILELTHTLTFQFFSKNSSIDFVWNSIDFWINKVISATNCYHVSQAPLTVLSLRAANSKEALHSNETRGNWVCPNWHKYYILGYYFTEHVPKIFN